jgi:hypothetical protein
MEQEVRHGEKAVYAGAYSGRSETGRAIKATRNRRDHGNSLRRVTLEKRSPGRDSNRPGLIIESLGSDAKLLISF